MKKFALTILVLSMIILSVVGCSKNDDISQEDYVKSIVGMVPEFTIEISNDFDWENKTQEERLSLIQASVAQCSVMSENDTTKEDFSAIGKNVDGKKIFSWDHKTKVVTMWVSGEKESINDPLN